MRLMAVKENVYYLTQIYFLCQFIPLVHHLLFLRMYNCEDYLGQHMNYVGLMDRDPVCPSFMGCIALSCCPTELSLGCQMPLAFCQFNLYDNYIS